MFPVMRIILATVGALFGATFGHGGDTFLDIVLGGVAGFCVAELSLLRADLVALKQELKNLKTAGGRHDEVAFEPQAQTPAQPQPQPLPLPQPQPPTRPQMPTSAARPELAAQRPAEITLITSVQRFLTGGNTLVRVGVVILFFGVAFLLRYAAEHSHLPIALRMAGVAAGGLALLVVGWVLRKSRPGYGFAVQGAGIGVLYLTIFASLRLYVLLPPTIAFALLVAVAALSAALALLQDSLVFAVLGVTGGFLAPVLTSTGDGSHVVLFSYFAVLNAGIVAMAWFKSWRPLNLVGFLFTFLIATVWGVLHYRAENFDSTEPFLAFFFLSYVAIAVLFTRNQPASLRGYVDGTLVFGVPLVAFGLQSAMLRGQPHALALSAVAMSALYLSLAWLLQRWVAARPTLLTEAFFALAAIFFTLVIPLAFKADATAAAWALEGSGLIWLGCRQTRPPARAFGSLLILAAGVAMLPALYLDVGYPVLPQASILSAFFLACAAVWSARITDSHREGLAFYELRLPQALFIWGLLWWLAAGASQWILWMPASYVGSATLIWFAVTAVSASEISRRFPLAFAYVAAMCLLPVMVLCAVSASHSSPHPFGGGGVVAWPVAFASFYLTARRHDASLAVERRRALHCAALWLLCGLLGWEASWEIDRIVGGSPAWALSAAILPASAAVLALPWAVRSMWPFARYRRLYLQVAGGGLAVGLACWSLYGNCVITGNSRPLAYVPLLNPFDVSQLFVLTALLRYRACLRKYEKIDPGLGDLRPVTLALVILVFIWANAALLRTVHQWAGVPFSAPELFGSTLVQTTLSIFWTVLALSTMLAAARKRARVAWLMGAGLMVVVVAKLFLIDLSRVGSVERIVSFLGVGLLMLIVGYWSPIPPSKEQVRPL